MGNQSINSYEKQNPVDFVEVWYEGATALQEGQGLCYNFDLGEATEANELRYNRVELPSASNARHFAGVAAQAYSAKTTKQLIRIYCPGSVCNILVGASVSIGVSTITCKPGGGDAGTFTLTGGVDGEGTAIPLQTVDGSGTATRCQAKLLSGPPSGLTGT